MGKMASKVTKRIMASVLTVAMIMSNMTVYASEYSEPAQQTEDTVENTGTDAAELPSTEDGTVQDEGAQDETTNDDAVQDDTAQDGTTKDEETTPGEDSDSTEKVDGDEETAQDGTDENVPEEEEPVAEEVSADLEAEEPNKAGEGTHTIYVVGDSTVCKYDPLDKYYYPRYGYGTQIENYLSENSGYTVNNLALSGRSSLSFLSETEYQTLKNGISAGDILIVGFGHNDEKAEKDRYTNPNGTSTTEGSFAKNLYDNYVKMATDKGAEVILCTPIVRRNDSAGEDGNTKLSDSNKHITSGSTGYPGGDYRKAVVDLGAEVNVPVVDLTTLTANLYESMTPEKTKEFHAWTQSKPTSVDNTHLNIYGAKMVAYMLANEIKTKNYTELAKAIASNIEAPTKAADLDTMYPVEGWKDPEYTAPDEDPTTTLDSYIIGEGANAVKFIGTAFGNIGGDTKVTTFTLGKDDLGYMNMVGTGSGKLITSGTDPDGFAMYYYRVPKESMFKISATAVVNSIGNEAQSSFGLMARDDMYIDVSSTSKTKPQAISNTNYVAAGTSGNGLYNCFRRVDTEFKSNAGLTTETIKVGGSYDLCIERNSDGYACTFGKEPTQSGGYDISLLTTDSEYIYIGMFISRTADITFKNIYLEVDGKVLADERKTQYSITMTDDGHGTAEALPSPAAANETITLTATPGEGYVLDHWEAKDATDTAINVVNNQFVMPASDVTVKAVFAELDFAEACVAEGTKDFTPATAVLTDFEGITFANFADEDNKHGFHSKGTGNPIINLHMEAGKKASITVLACCYGAGSSGNNILDSSSGVVTEKVIEEETGKNGTQFNVLNVDAEYVTLTIGNNMFIHNIMVEYAQEIDPNERKIDVWDFGAKEETNTELYKNNITYVEWLGYKSSVGSDGKFTAAGDYPFGDVTITGVLVNDRLYSNETELAGMNAGANYANLSVDGDSYKTAGAYYCNGTGGASRRLLTVKNVQAGDKIVLYIGNSQSGTSDIGHFAGQGPASEQDDTFTLLDGKIQKQEFIAKYTGTYKIYTNGSNGKPLYYRVMRVPGVKVSGTIDFNDIELPEGYSILLVNQTTNDETVAELGVNEAGDPSFTASLAPGYTYKAALAGATGYGFTNESAGFTVENEQILTGKNDVRLVVEEKDTFDYAGKIKGFASNYAKLNNLKITLTPPATSSDDKIVLNIDAENPSDITFNATLAPDVEYSLVMEGVNDYEVVAPLVIKKSGDETGTSHENRTITVREREKYDVSGGFMGLSNGAEVTALTFTNVADDYVYNAAINSYKDGYSIELRDGEYLASATVTNHSTRTHVVVKGGSVSKDLMFVSTAEKAKIDYVSDIYVGYPAGQENNYATVSEAMEACDLMKRDATTPERITVHIAPGTYREQIMVKAPNVSLVNDSKNGEEVILTWYYGIGYKYYSACGGNNSFYDAERAYDKYEKNIAAKWGTAVYVQSTATAFRAEGITFEHTFNRYVTEEELADGVEVAGNEKINFVRNLRSDVASRAATERATAICVEADQSEFKDCSFYSSQDTLYTAADAYFKNCIIEGQTDYIFGSGNCVFDSCELSWKGYSTNSQGGYITANRPDSGDLGYLFRNCTVTANAHNDLTVVGGYWGRPWGADAAVKFMNTKLQSADLIVNAGWTEMSGAKPENAKFKEYNTTTMDGSTVSTTGRTSGTIMTDTDAAAVKVADYFAAWPSKTPVYYTPDSDETVEIDGDLSLSDNGDINYLLPGHTLTVGYTLNSVANNANDASIVKWYTVKYTNGTAGTPKLVKTANGAIDKTYKISKTDIGSYIKVTVTPGTVSGKSGTMKELTLYKTGDYDHVVNDGYYDPTTGSSSSLGDGVNVFLAGDSTTKDYSENGMYNNGTATNLGSWGEFLQCFFDESEVKIQNYANGGRSTRSFINDGSFDKIKDQISAGDYLFIQFAHNDSSAISSKKDVYVPLGEPNADGIYPYTAGEKVNGKYPDYKVSAGSSAADNGTATYKWFLKQYVEMALDAGATPVLLTPVARMYVNESDGKMKDHHYDEGSTAKRAFGYCEAVKQVYNDYKAENKNVLFIDAYTITADFYTNAWNSTDKNANNKQVMCIGDSTHSNKLGGMLTAAAYAKELQKLNITISEAVKAPSNVSALTVADVSNGITAGNAVFNIDVNGNLTAYDLTKNCSARATYWEGIGTTILTAIKTKADELGNATAEGAVATPTATLSKNPDADGNVESGTTVTLGCTTAGAKIYYTTDGSNPKVSLTKTEYVDGTTVITITENTTIKAYATKTDMSDSKIAVFTYTMAPLVKAPTAKTPSGAAVKSGTKIELETATTTEGVQIRYTMGTNPADPTKYSTRYDAVTGIIIKNDVTIKAIAVLGDDISEVSTFTYTIDTTASTEIPVKPASDTASGPVTIGKVIKLTTTTQGAVIYYTMGADPAVPTDSNSDICDDDGIVINSNVKIKAVAIKDGVSSDVAEFEYTVPTTPAPSFTPGEGEISEGESVTLKVVPEAGVTLSGIKIYYTTDKTNPKTSNTRTEVVGDTATIPITANTTIKAYATSTGLADSEVITCKYTLETTPVPTVNPDPDIPVPMGTKVTLSVTAKDGTALSGVKLHYTIDGSNPKNSASKVTVEKDAVELTINADTTIRAYAEVEGLKESAEARYEYKIASVAAPTASPEPVADEYVKKGTRVKLSSTTETAEIWYTTELGENEAEIAKDALSTKYGSPIVIERTTVIYAYAKAEKYKDSEIKKFVYTVEPAPEINDKAGIEIVGLEAEYDFTGAKITPDFSVVDNGIKVNGTPKVLTLGIDYTVKYANNSKENSTATVTVVGKGNYAGKTVTATFKIKAANKVTAGLENLKGAKFVGKIAPQTYTGEACYPTFTLKIGSKEYTYEYMETGDGEGEYVRKDGLPMNVNVALSNNINKGTATILVTGQKVNNKLTSVKKTFKINPVDLSKNKENLEVNYDSSVPYAVKGATPEVEVIYTFSSDGGDREVTLVNGKDYTVKYSSNKKPGVKGKITITGKGNYNKKAPVKEFEIDKLDLQDTNLVAVTACTNLQAGKVKATVVDENGDVIKANQYTVEVYKADGATEYKPKEVIKEDTIYVKAVAKKGKNICLEEESETGLEEFSVGENIAKAKVKLKFKSKGYTGAAIELADSDLEVTLKVKGQTKTLTMAKEDFEIVSYSNNINKGTATAVIKGTGAYSGTKTVKFKIVAKTMKKQTATN